MHNSPNVGENPEVTGASSVTPPPFCRANGKAGRPSTIGPSCDLLYISSQVLTAPKHRHVANIAT
eukprot:6180485-Pleurochrysis_carterae.AAC.3